VKGQKGEWRMGEALLNNHFENLFGEACELETRVLKPLVGKFSFKVGTIPS
jgi:hypothetical protein